MLEISGAGACVLLRGQCSASISLIAANIYFVAGMRIVCEFNVYYNASIVVPHYVLFLGANMGFCPSFPGQNNLTWSDVGETDAIHDVLSSGSCCACMHNI